MASRSQLGATRSRSRIVAWKEPLSGTARMSWSRRVVSPTFGVGPADDLYVGAAMATAATAMSWCSCLWSSMWRDTAAAEFFLLLFFGSSERTDSLVNQFEAARRRCRRMRHHQRLRRPDLGARRGVGGRRQVPEGVQRQSGHHAALLHIQRSSIVTGCYESGGRHGALRLQAPQTDRQGEGPDGHT